LGPNQKAPRAEAAGLHDIAEGIVTSITTPKGVRPARTGVGGSFVADTLNAAMTPVQAGAVEALGLNHLATVTIV
jgi:hypothetical protein